MDLHENLKGKTVVITGGSGILCREFAFAYAKQGMNVAVLGRTLSKLEEVRDKINELGGNGLAVVCDVVDKDSVINAKKYTCKRCRWQSPKRYYNKRIF